MFLWKNWNFDENHQWRTRIWGKTSKLEDQYTNIFNLALWPEEPPEIRKMLDFRKTTSQVAPQAKVPMQKASYIDPLILKFSFKFELFTGNFHPIFSSSIKAYFLFSQYTKLVLKESGFGKINWGVSSVQCLVELSFFLFPDLFGQKSFF